MILVEGVADRVMVESVAAASGVDLDRLGIAVASVNGAGGFKMALQLLGPNGFDVPLVGLVDAKEAADVAGYLGIDAAAVPAAGFTICDPDLEGECVSRLGAEVHAGLLCSSGSFSATKICSANGVGSLVDLVAEPYAAWCRRNKTEVAVALAGAISASDAAALVPLHHVVSQIVSKLA